MSRIMIPRNMIVILIPLVVTISFAMDVYIAAIPQMLVALKTTASNVQWTLTIFMLAVSIGQLILGPLSDHFGRRAIALLSGWLFLIGSILCVMALSIEQLILARFIQALGACGTCVIAYAVVKDCYDGDQAAKYYSLLNGLNAIVAVSAPIIGGVIIGLSQNWRYNFVFLSIMALCILIEAYLFLPDTRRRHLISPVSCKETIKRYITLFCDLNYLRYSFFVVCGLLGLYLFCCLSPHILIEQYHVSPLRYGFYFGANAAVVFIANSLCPHVTRRLGLDQTIVIGYCVMLLGLVLMLIAESLFEPSTITFLLPMFIVGAGIGFVMGPATSLAMAKYTAISGTASALLGALQYGLPGAIGIFLFNHHATLNVNTFITPMLCFMVVTAIANTPKLIKSCFKVFNIYFRII